MAVPYTFATATSAIPLSQLDTNFATAITLGSTSLTLGTTTTSVSGLTLVSPTLTTPALGTPASGTLTNCTGLPLTTGVTGTLAVTNGGTGVTTSTGSGSNVLNTSPTLVTPVLGTPTSGTLTNCTGYPTSALSGTISLTSQVTGTLPVANGGTNLTSFTANGVVYASSTSALATGSALQFDGTNLAVGATPTSFGAGYSVITAKGSTSGFVQASNGTIVTELGTYSGVGYIGTRSNNSLTFNANGSEYMRLTTSGYLGIGTSSPSYPLSVVGSVGGIAASIGGSTYSFKVYTDTSQVQINDGGAEWISFVPGSNFMSFATNSSERMRIDTSGNLGLGVTPSAWYASNKAIQIGSTGALSNFTSGGNIQTFLANNVYWNAAGTISYLTTNTATSYTQDNGTHKWYYAPSGTAGNAISFTQAMTLDNSGNLGLGTTSPSSYSAKLVSNGNISLLGGNKLYLWDSTNSYTPALMANGANLTFLGNSGSEQMRIDSSGRLMINTTSAITGTFLTVQGKIGTNQQTSGCVQFDIYETVTSLNIVSLSSPGTGTMCVVRVDYTNLYGYVGGYQSTGSIIASTRYNTSGGTWSTLSVDLGSTYSGGDIRPSLSFTNNVCTLTQGSSQVLIARVTVTWYNCTPSF